MRSILLFICLVITTATLAQFPKLATSKGHAFGIMNVSFNPNGKTLISTDETGVSIVWDVQSGKEIFSFKAGAKEEDGDNFPTFSPNGRYIFSGTLIYSASNGKKLDEIKSENGSLSFLPDERKFYFSRNGEDLLITSQFGGLKLYNISSGKVKKEQKFEGTAIVDKIIVGSNNNYLVQYQTDDDGVNIVILDSNLQIKKKLIDNLDKDINGIAYSAKGDYVAITYNKTMDVYSTKDYRIIKTFKGEYAEYFDVFFNPVPVAGAPASTFLFVKTSGQYMYTSDKDWGALKRTQIHGAYNFSVKGKLAIAGGREVIILDLLKDEVINRVGLKNTGYRNGIGEDTKIQNNFEGHTDDINQVQFSIDEKYIATGSADHTVKIWDVQTGELVNTLGVKSKSEGYYFFADNGTELLNFQIGDRIYSLNTLSVKIDLLQSGVKEINPEESLTYPEVFKFENVFNKDRSLQLTMGKEKFLVTNLRTKEKKELPLPLTGMTGYNKAAFSSDNKYLLIYSNIMGNCAVVYDIKTSRILSHMCLDDRINDARFSFNNKFVLMTSAFDGTIQYWNFQEGKTVLEITPIQFSSIKESRSYFDGFYFVNHDDEGHVAFLSKEANGYYYMQFGGERFLHYVTEDGNILSIEQLDLKYNRPDKVLQAIHSSDSSLIKAYYRGYLKRIEKLNVDTSSFNKNFNLPRAYINNRDKIEPQQATATLKLQLGADAGKDKLDRYNIWVNEVPLYGSKGVKLSGERAQRFDGLEVVVPLSSSKNKIEFSVINVNGIESYLQPLFVNCTLPEVKTPKTYFIGIGTNRFSSGSNPLKWCATDIRSLAEKLKSKFGKNLVIDTLLNEKVTLENVKRLKAKLLTADVNDKVIIAFSGHGLFSADYDYYLSGYNINFKKPEEGGIPYEVLEDLVDGIAPRKKVILLDACNSGERDKGTTGRSVNGGRGIGDSIEVVGLQKNSLGILNSFDLMEDMFVKVQKGTGATVIAAAKGYQAALEQNELGHGVFTWSILEAMDKNAEMTISQLKRWVNKEVIKLTNGKQQPTTRNEPIDFDWNVW